MRQPISDRHVLQKMEYSCFVMNKIHRFYVFSSFSCSSVDFGYFRVNLVGLVKFYVSLRTSKETSLDSHTSFNSHDGLVI